MKILLIYPWFLDDRISDEDIKAVPMGLYYVAAMLKEKGYATDIANWHDMGAHPNTVEKVLKEEAPDIIGFSIMHANRWGGIDIAQTARRLNPGVRIVFGGIGATYLWEHLLSTVPEIDAVVLGEGEKTFVLLVRHWEENRDETELSAIDGIAYRKDGRPVCNRPAEPVKDLDALPNPAKYFPFSHLALTRGCPGKCAFCGSPRFWGPSVRFHSAAYFVDQMELQYHRGQRFFFVSDDTFTVNRKRAVAVCKEILHRQLSVSWAAISQAATVNEEVLYWMRKAGCIQVSYGVESGSEQHRKTLNKPVSEEVICRAFELTARFGMMARAYFIYGCPGETWETIEETVNLIRKIRPLSAVFYILDIFPGTALYEDFKKRTGKDDSVWSERVEDIMYFETDDALSGKEILAFGKYLRSEYYRMLPSFAQSLPLVDKEEFYPLHADFLSRLGLTFHQGEYAQNEQIPDKRKLAESLYRRALEYGPDARAFLGLGMLAQQRGDMEAAVVILDRALEIFPRNPQLILCLAISHMNRGKFDTALQRLQPLSDRPEAAPYIEECRRQTGQR